MSRPLGLYLHVPFCLSKCRYCDFYSGRASEAEKEADWEFTVKCALIIQDLMAGNPNLPEGCEEEMVGHNAIAAGFQGQRQWTDAYPNTDFPEAILNSSLRSLNSLILKVQKFKYFFLKCINGLIHR